MEISESKALSICSFYILVLCIPYVVSSYHGEVRTTSPSQPLKFFMQPHHRKIPILGAEHDDLRADGSPNENSIAMLVNISFGYPPVPQLLIMDTASELIWVQCASCTTCFKKTTPLYDPLKSKTYNDVDCGSSLCQIPLECNESSRTCAYNIKYVGNSTTKGKVGTDQLTFKMSDNRTFTVGKVVFGCGTENNLLPKDYDFGSGILGLRPAPLSLTSQKGRQFSYCIGNLNNHSYAYNQLIIGDGAVFRGYTTPLEVYNYNYYITMVGISVGDKLLNIDPKIFLRPPSSEGGMIIDSGTTLSYLPRVAYEALKEEVISVVGNSWKINTIGDDLCYWTFLNKTGGFPTVKFHLADNADIKLQPNSFFIQTNWFTTCMAIKPAKEGYHGYIGIMAQQNYNVGYDLENKQLYIDNVDCERI